MERPQSRKMKQETLRKQDLCFEEPRVILRYSRVARPCRNTGLGFCGSRTEG